MECKISSYAVVVASKQQVSCDLAGEAVILDLKSSVYYGLDAIGARIWKLIQEPMTVNDIRDVLLHEYDVEPERCERELVALLEEMAMQGLIEIGNGATA